MVFMQQIVPAAPNGKDRGHLDRRAGPPLERVWEKALDGYLNISHDLVRCMSSSEKYEEDS
jgi:hypothetical protein